MCKIFQLIKLCYCYRHLGGGDSVAVGNVFHRIQNHNGEVLLRNKQDHASDLRRLNKAAVVIQVLYPASICCKLSHLWVTFLSYENLFILFAVYFIPS